MLQSSILRLLFVQIIGFLLIDSVLSGQNYDTETPEVRLIQAARKGDIDVVTDLLHRGTNPNCFNENGVTPLHFACDGGFQDVVRLLLAENADPNAQAKTGFTPLHCAVYFGRTQTVQLLLEMGASANIKDKAGNVPLHVAVNKKHVDIQQMLEPHTMVDLTGFITQQEAFSCIIICCGAFIAIVYLINKAVIAKKSIRRSTVSFSKRKQR